MMHTLPLEQLQKRHAMLTLEHKKLCLAKANATTQSQHNKLSAKIRENGFRLHRVNQALHHHQQNTVRQGTQVLSGPFSNLRDKIKDKVQDFKPSGSSIKQNVFNSGNRPFQNLRPKNVVNTISSTGAGQIVKDAITNSPFQNRPKLPSFTPSQPDFEPLPDFLPEPMPMPSIAPQVSVLPNFPQIPMVPTKPPVDSGFQPPGSVKPEFTEDQPPAEIESGLDLMGLLDEYKYILGAGTLLGIYFFVSRKPAPKSNPRKRRKVNKKRKARKSNKKAARRSRRS